MKVRNSRTNAVAVDIGRLMGLSSADRDGFSECVGYAMAMRHSALYNNSGAHCDQVNGMIQEQAREYMQRLAPFFKHAPRINNLDHPLARISRNQQHPYTYMHPVYARDAVREQPSVVFYDETYEESQRLAKSGISSSGKRSFSRWMIFSTSLNACLVLHLHNQNTTGHTESGCASHAPRTPGFKSETAQIPHLSFRSATYSQ